MSDTAIIKLIPIINVGGIFPLIMSNKELEKTINAMQAGSMQIKEVTA